MMPCKTCLGASALALAVCLPAHTWAQVRPPAPPEDAPVGRGAPPNFLEEVVVTGVKSGDFGVKSGIPIARTPQSIQVLDTDDLVQRGARTIDDALRAVPSATVAGSRTVPGSGSFVVKIRGFSPDQLRNGIRQRYFEDVDPSALSDIERIEVLKGPSAVLYGESGVGGLVSVITKQPTQAFAGSLALTGGSYDQRMVTFDVGGPITGTLGVRLTGEFERSGTFVDFQNLDRDNLGLSLVWTPRPWMTAHVVAEYLRRSTLTNPGLSTVGTVISNGVATVDRSTFLGEPRFAAQDTHAPLVQSWVEFALAGGWTLTPRFQYSEFNNRTESAVLLGPAAAQQTRIDRQGRFAGEHDRFYIGQLDLAGQLSTFGVGHKLLFGVEYSSEQVAFRNRSPIPCGTGPIDALRPVYGCGPPTTAFAFLSDNKVKSFAGYAQDQIALTPKWNVVAGVRHAEIDNDNTFSTAFFSSPTTAQLSQTSWQLGTTYALGAGVSLFGGYNTGYDLEYVIGARRFDGSPFDPETSDQAELGVRLTRRTLRASASLFRIRRNNVAVPDPANIGFQIQEGRFRTQGVEVEGEWSPLPGWWLQGGYAYLDGEVTRSTNAALVGARLFETPEHSVTAATRYTLGRFELRASANYVGSRKVINGGAVTLPDYVVVNLGAGTQIGPVQLDAVLTNVGDETYYFSNNGSVYSVGGENFVYPGEPRTFSLRATYRFGAGR